jgi:hypothetical protein
VVGLCCADEFHLCAYPVFRSSNVCATTPERFDLPFNDLFSFDLVPVAYTYLLSYTYILLRKTPEYYESYGKLERYQSTEILSEQDSSCH